MAKSEKRQINAQRREREKLLREMSSLIFLIRGSYFERFSTCSRPNCRCHQGQRHGPRSYVAVTEGKRQRQHYVPKGQQAAVKLGVDQYHRLLELMSRVTMINLELMRLNALDQGQD